MVYATAELTAAHTTGSDVPMSDFQFTIAREDFAEAVNWVARALPAKPLNPVLGAVRLVSDGSCLMLEAFDYEVAAATSVPAEVATPGTALVSGRLLQAISKSLARKPVEFLAEGGVARILCGAAEFTLPAMRAADYPDLPPRPAAAGSVAADQFAEAVAQTAFAAYRGADGYSNIKPICFDVDPLGGLTLSATDRYRIATRTIPWQPTLDAVEQPVRLLVPTRALGDTARLGGDTVRLGFKGDEPSLLSFVGDTRCAITQLMAEDFPKLDALFPAEYTAVASIAVTELTEPLARALALDARDFPRVKLSFGPDVLRMSGGEDGVGGIREDVPIVFAGEPLDMWLNPKYLLEGLIAAHADRVDIGMTGTKRPLTLAPHAGLPHVSAAGSFPAFASDFRYLLMPAQPPAGA